MSQQVEFNWSIFLVRSSLFALLVVAIIQFFNILYSDVNTLTYKKQTFPNSSEPVSEVISEQVDTVDAPSLLNEPKVDLVEADRLYEHKKTIETKEIHRPLVGQQE